MARDFLHQQYNGVLRTHGSPSAQFSARRTLFVDLRGFRGGYVGRTCSQPNLQLSTYINILEYITMEYFLFGGAGVLMLGGGE